MSYIYIGYKDLLLSNSRWMHVPIISTIAVLYHLQVAAFSNMRAARAQQLWRAVSVSERA